MKVKKIFIHVSDSEFGNALMIDKWHREGNKWGMIGYHEVILNGKPFSSTDYMEHWDGIIQPGRPLDSDSTLESNEVGAHVRGYNKESIGICLIGVKEFTNKQLLTLKKSVSRYLKQFNLITKDVEGHCEIDSSKTCPNMPMGFLRDWLSDHCQKYGVDSLREVRGLIWEHNNTCHE